jgi:uncharacterized iron-regulated membrane protein
MKPRCHAASLALALAGIAAPAAAGSQLFKCVDGGRTVYQQQACPASTAAEPASALKAEAASQTAPRKLKPPSASASAAPATSR